MTLLESPPKFIFSIVLISSFLGILLACFYYFFHSTINTFLLLMTTILIFIIIILASLFYFIHTLIKTNKEKKTKYHFIARELGLRVIKEGITIPKKIGGTYRGHPVIIGPSHNPTKIDYRPLIIGKRVKKEEIKDPFLDVMTMNKSPRFIVTTIKFNHSLQIPKIYIYPKKHLQKKLKFEPDNQTLEKQVLNPKIKKKIKRMNTTHIQFHINTQSINFTTTPKEFNKHTINEALEIMTDITERIEKNFKIQKKESKLFIPEKT